MIVCVFQFVLMGGRGDLARPALPSAKPPEKMKNKKEHRPLLCLCCLQLHVGFITDSPRQFKVSGSVCITKISSFQACFQGLKSRKTVPKASKKRHKSISKSIKNDFRDKSFLQYLQSENLDLEVPNVEMSIHTSMNKWRGDKPANKIKFHGF